MQEQLPGSYGTHHGQANRQRVHIHMPSSLTHNIYDILQ